MRLKALHKEPCDDARLGEAFFYRAETTEVSDFPTYSVKAVSHQGEHRLMGNPNDHFYVQVWTDHGWKTVLDDAETGEPHVAVRLALQILGIPLGAWNHGQEELTFG